MERLVIRHTHPSINAKERPFWMLTERYHNIARDTRHNTRPSLPPWKTPLETPLARRMLPPLPMLTSYFHEGEEFFDLKEILNPNTQQFTRHEITVQKGTFDLTNWRTIKRAWGTSKIKVHPPWEPFEGTLQEWKTGKIKEGKILIWPHFTKEIEVHEILANLEDFDSYLERAPEEDLAFLWRCRHTLCKETQKSKYKFKSLLFGECERRWATFRRQPFEIRIPYFEQIDKHKILNLVKSLINQQDWPEFLKKWHCSKVSLITSSVKKIEEILVNVNMPWRPRGCVCEQIERGLRKQGFEGSIPKINNHIFFISRDYEGPHKEVLRWGAGNNPHQTFEIWYTSGRSSFPFLHL